MIDLGNLHLITDRPGATPAPTPPAQPTPPLPPASPWQPRHNDDERPTADIVADLRAAIVRSRLARGASTDDLPWVA